MNKNKLILLCSLFAMVFLSTSCVTSKQIRYLQDMPKEGIPLNKELEATICPYDELRIRVYSNGGDEHAIIHAAEIIGCRIDEARILEDAESAEDEQFDAEQSDECTADRAADAGDCEEFFARERHAVNCRFGNAEDAAQKCGDCNALELLIFRAENDCEDDADLSECRSEHRNDDRIGSVRDDVLNHDRHKPPVKPSDYKQLPACTDEQTGE